MNTPRVFRPTPEQVEKWTRTIEGDPTRVLIFYVGTECGMPVSRVEERLRDAGMNLDHVQVFQPEPEDGEVFEELRGHKGIGIVKGDSGEDPLNTVWDLGVNQLTWVFYGGPESDCILELDDMINDGRDYEPLIIKLVSEYRTDDVLEAIDYLDEDREEILEPLEEYPYLVEALGTLWTEIAIRDNY